MAIIKPAYIYNAGAGDVTITFTQPIQGEPIFEPKFKVRDAIGGSGIRQRQLEYYEEITTLHHAFETLAVRDAVILMLTAWVGAGGSFKFVPDQTVPGTFFTVELMDDSFASLDRQFTNLARYEFKLKVRKAIT